MKIFSERNLVLLMGLIILATFTATAHSGMKKQSKTENIMVQKNTWTAIALHGLPRGVSLTVEAKSTGPITIILLDKEQYDRFPEGSSTVFEGLSDNGLGFNVVLRHKGDYFLVLDNRKSDQDTQVVTLITATVGR